MGAGRGQGRAWKLRRMSRTPPLHRKCTGRKCRAGDQQATAPPGRRTSEACLLPVPAQLSHLLTHVSLPYLQINNGNHQRAPFCCRGHTAADQPLGPRHNRDGDGAETTTFNMPCAPPLQPRKMGLSFLCCKMGTTPTLMGPLSR